MKIEEAPDARFCGLCGSFAKGYYLIVSHRHRENRTPFEAPHDHISFICWVCALELKLIAKTIPVK